jgi:hypothetical protein
MNGAPKPVVTGKKGNVGGISTPGRHGVGSGLNALVKPGPGKTVPVKVSNMPRPEGAVHIVKTAGAQKTGTMPHTHAGAPSKAVRHGAKVTAKGHSGIHVGVRPEGAIKRSPLSPIKP